jgi:hypothetical protein
MTSNAGKMDNGLLCTTFVQLKQSLFSCSCMYVLSKGFSLQSCILLPFCNCLHINKCFELYLLTTFCFKFVNLLSTLWANHLNFFVWIENG